MPELPEVENVCRGLRQLISTGTKSLELKTLRPNLRVPFPKHLERIVSGQKILAIHRRAKFILFELETHMLISHLGMTGNWRAQQDTSDQQLHDHVRWRLSNGRTLVYQDPRRFGLLALEPKAEWQKSSWLRHLGPEPLDEQLFTAQVLYHKSRGKRVAVKVFLMDQKVVVGVGNIYASEALYRARVKPQRKAYRLKLHEIESIVSAVREVLQEAIQTGGSTIRDYRQANGAEGGFQERLRVYERAGDKCVDCKSQIRQCTLGGRSTYYCPQCQK